MDLQIQIKRRINNILLLSLLWTVTKNKSKNRKQKKRFWARDLFKHRKTQGAFHNLLQEMRLTDQEKYYNYLRMSSNTFQNLLKIIGPRLNKIYCVREPISAEERLSLTLRLLASGDSMISLSYAFRIAHNTVSIIIRETCNVIWESLCESQLIQPNVDSWLEIEKDFQDRWQLPHCVGAMDGKHVVIQAPPMSGSTFHNYKGSHSIVLLALCDAQYRFTLVDIGGEGRHSDGGIFKNSTIGQRINSNDMNFPAPRTLGSGNVPLNYFIAADGAFPLSVSTMRPYPGSFLPQQKRIFNYRLCRARRVIENVFGILASRWRIYRKPRLASLSTVVPIVKATVCLHNFLINSEKFQKEKRYFPNNAVDHENENGDTIQGDWRGEENNNLLSVRRTSTNIWEKCRKHETGVV